MAFSSVFVLANACAAVPSNALSRYGRIREGSNPIEPTKSMKRLRRAEQSLVVGAHHSSADAALPFAHSAVTSIVCRPPTRCRELGAER